MSEETLKRRRKVPMERGVNRPYFLTYLHEEHGSNSSVREELAHSEVKRMNPMESGK